MVLKERERERETNVEFSITRAREVCVHVWQWRKPTTQKLFPGWEGRSARITQKALSASLAMMRQACTTTTTT